MCWRSVAFAFVSGFGPLGRLFKESGNNSDRKNIHLRSAMPFRLPTTKPEHRPDTLGESHQRTS